MSAAYVSDDLVARRHLNLRRQSHFRCISDCRIETRAFSSNLVSQFFS